MVGITARHPVDCAGGRADGFICGFVLAPRAGRCWGLRRLWRDGRLGCIGRKGVDDFPLGYGSATVLYINGAAHTECLVRDARQLAIVTTLGLRTRCFRNGCSQVNGAFGREVDRRTVGAVLRVINVVSDFPFAVCAALYDCMR